MAAIPVGLTRAASLSMRHITLIIFLLASGYASSQNISPVFSFENGVAEFKSEAPLELIRASSQQLKGLIDFEKATFAFVIPVGSFKGFNSALQQEHFNENYMESNRFPRATFTGRLIEKIDVDNDGEYRVRAKGILNIHGVEQERIIQGLVIVRKGTIALSAQFDVLLRDHNIPIPKVVQHKIAESIHVEINTKGTSQ